MTTCSSALARFAAPLLPTALVGVALAAAPAAPPQPAPPTPTFSGPMPCVPRLSNEHMTVVGSSGVYRREVLTLAVSPDRYRIVTAGADGVLQVRNTISGVDFCVADANVLALSSDGRYGAGVALNATWKDWKADGGVALVLYDMEKGAELRRLTMTVPTGLSLAVSSTGAVAFAGVDTPLQIWEEAGARPVEGLSGLPAALVFSADGKTLTAGSNSGPSDLVNVATAKATAHLPILAEAAPAAGAPPAAPAPIALTAASAGKKLVAFAGLRGGDAVIEVWDPASPKKAKVVLASPAPGAKGITRTVRGATGLSQTSAASARALALSPDDKVLAVAFDGTPTVFRYELPSGDPLPPLTISGPPSSVAFSGDGEWLIASNPDGLLGAWDKAGAVLGYPPVSVIVADKPLDQVGNRVMIGEKDSVRVMEGADQRWTAQFERPPWEAVRLSSDGALAWTGGNKGSVVYDAESGKELWRMSDYGHSYDARFSADASTIVISSLTGVVQFKSKNGRLVRNLVGGGGTAPIAFSRDDKRVAGITAEHTLTVWSTLTGRPQGQSNMGDTVRPSGLAFTADGKYVVTAELQPGVIGTPLKLWSGEDASPVTSLSFAPLKVDPYRVNLTADGQIEVVTRGGNAVLVEVR